MTADLDFDELEKLATAALDGQRCMAYGVAFDPETVLALLALARRTVEAERECDGSRRMLARVYDQLLIIPHQRADVLATEIAAHMATLYKEPTP